MARMEAVEVDSAGGSASAASRKQNQAKHSRPFPRPFSHCSQPNCRPISLLLHPDRFSDPFSDPVPPGPTKKSCTPIPSRQTNGFLPSRPIPIPRQTNGKILEKATCGGRVRPIPYRACPCKICWPKRFTAKCSARLYSVPAFGEAPGDCLASQDSEEVLCYCSSIKVTTSRSEL